MPDLKSLPFPFAAVVLTGGSSGIGKSLIKHIGRLNPDVPICNLSRRDAIGFSAELKRRQIKVDLSDRASRQTAIEQVLAFLQSAAPNGPVLVINNAGFGSYGEFHQADPATQGEIIEVNLNAVIDLTRGLLPVLMERGGTFMNVASLTAFQPTPFIATYGATKAFLLHWGYALRYELAGTGVKVMTVCPGSTDTAFHDRAGITVRGPAARFAQHPDRVAHEALVALARGRAHVVTGFSNRLVSRLAPLLPWRLATYLSGWVLARLRAENRPNS